MSNFATAFAQLLSGGEEYKEARIAESMRCYGHTRAEAVIVDEAILTGIQSACREIGAALDGLNAKLLVDAFPILLSRASDNVAALEETCFAIVMGKYMPTPSCDCQACEAIIAVRREMTAVEAEVRTQTPPTRH